MPTTILQRKQFKRKRTALTKQNVARIARRVLQSSAENKWYLRVLQGTTTDPSNSQPNGINATWSFASSLQGLQEAFSVNGRTGDRIFLRRIEFYVRLQPIVGANMADGSRCRLVVYHNKIANGALPAALDIFDYDRLDTLRNIRESKSVSILRDHCHQMVATSGDGPNVFTAGPEATFIWRVPVNQEVTYQQNTGAITGVFQHDYGIGIVADENCCRALITSKLVFTDV